MYHYKNLKNVSYREIASCLNLAFSDYYIPIQLTESQIPHFFKASGVDEKLSFGAFSDSQMVGFIFNSRSIYNEEQAVFDVGTGVIPKERGKKVFTNLFKVTEQELRQYQIEKYYLEVLQQNDRAVSLYKRQGFSIVREFVVLNACGPIEETVHDKVKYLSYNEFDFNKVKHCKLVRPSYEHSTNILKLNPDFNNIAYVEDGTISAFCVFAKENGQILQLGYRNIQDLRLIIQCLLSTFNNIMAKNIDMKELEVLEMLYSIGFKEVTKQFEMVKNISIN